MVKTTNLLGLLAGISSVILWIILQFFNPYLSSIEFEPFMNTLFFLLLPAILGIYASLAKRKTFMLIAFLWSVPLSLYLTLTPGIFAFFGLTCFMYLISYLLLAVGEKRKWTKSTSIIIGRTTDRNTATENEWHKMDISN